MRPGQSTHGKSHRQTPLWLQASCLAQNGTAPNGFARRRVNWAAQTEHQWLQTGTNRGGCLNRLEWNSTGLSTTGQKQASKSQGPQIFEFTEVHWCFQMQNQKINNLIKIESIIVFDGFVNLRPKI
jgi:hypothetical protein